MTDQLTQAATDYPDELKVVMEAAGYVWDDEDDCVLPLPMDTYTTSPKSIYTTGVNGKRIVCHFPTDHDAIVATLTWLMIHDDECDWTRILSLGRQLWRHGKPVMAHELSLLERLLIGVRETLENSTGDGG